MFFLFSSKLCLERQTRENYFDWDIVSEISGKKQHKDNLESYKNKNVN